VSKRRLPFYAVFLEVVVTAGLVFSVVGTVQHGKGWCLASIVYFVSTLAEYLNGYVSGAILMCGSIEGVVVGITKVLLRQERRQALEIGRQEGIQEGIQRGREMERDRLRRAGIEPPPNSDSTESKNTES
jgi:hypothetical protein